MEPDAFTLTRLLCLAALLGATIEYVEIVQRRARARLMAVRREESADPGLRGLVRVLLVDEP